MLTTLLQTHITFAFLSLMLLIVRGYMQLQGKDWRTVKLLKITPHLADTLLVLSGVALVFVFGYELQMWLIGKVLLLVLYAFFSAKFFQKNAVKSNILFLILALSAFLAAMYLGYFH
ncbi:SirB2 family protein [Basfia succiniciproducens]|uniref:SirB2 family protein n=1 Tax=Basfia succiniciproducens TaxID=653940 RepID=UPI0008D1D031|nr:SirB2 family protein [Basfia succiniciproducens]SEP81274.1 Uncharacterized membrane protein SirB2 [Basfia succiniciproducens]